MEAETSHDASSAIQFGESSITGSTVELKTYKPPKDEITGQKNQSEINNTSSTGNTVHSPDLEESREVAIFQEAENDVGKLREDLEAQERQHTTDTTTQLEDATPTKEVDNDFSKVITKEEHNEKVGVTVEDNTNQDEEAEDFLQEEKSSEVFQKGNKGLEDLGGDGSISSLMDKAVETAADDETKDLDPDTKERQDSFDPTEAVEEPCGSPSLHDPEGILSHLKENGGNGTTATSDPDQDGEGHTSTSCQKDALAQNIHHGELLLYRLHLVQQNQELQQVSDGPSASNTVAMVTANDTLKSVSIKPGTEGDSDDMLPCKVEIIQGNERQKEVVDTSSADTEEDSQAEMGKENIPRPLEETPIQREIRQGLEREKSLRRSRGLGDLEKKSQELVEIPVKRSSEVSDQPLGINVGINADKRLAKRKMLQDINQEVMKEQAVKKLGKVPGLYHESYAQELKERRMLFEAFHQCKKTDTQGFSRGRKLFSSSFTARVSESPFVSRLERSRSLDFFTINQFKYSTTPTTGKEPHQNDIESHRTCQVKDSEDDATPASSHETQSLLKPLHPSISLSSLDRDSGMMPSVQDIKKENEEGSVLKGKNPFFQLRPSLSLRPDVEKEIREAMEREQELRRMRSRLYGEQWTGQGEKMEGNPLSTCPESTSTVYTDHVYRGKLTLIWPPPCSKVEKEIGPSQPVGERSTLQHCWEMGRVNRSCSQKD